jgi:hypothetical protein
MPQNAALITALIIERPLCLDCIAAKASLSDEEVRSALGAIERALEVQYGDPDRCRACGTVGPVVSLPRLPL